MRTATYARYSSDSQREASIEDQLRDNRAVCERHCWPAPTVYSDSGISGSRRDRPDYMRLLADMRDGRIDVLVLWDLKRLSRAEDLPQVLAQLKFWRVRVITCDGYDSAQEDSDLRGWFDAMLGNRYLKDLAKATHRGLMGQALKGLSAGGLPYGYRAVASCDGRTREIEPAQAEWVRKIFEWYVDGMTSREIAAALNRNGVPSPRGSTWAVSAIYGDKRGIGILGNPIYAGRWIWNRSHWVKDPATGRRTRQERPESEWVIKDHPELRIVSEELWEEAQQRQRQVRAKTRAVQAVHGPAARGGRGPKYLFSGLLQCGVCGGSFVVVDYYRYGCGTHKDRGHAACGNSAKVARATVETVLLAGIKQEMLSEEAYRVFEAEARAALREAHVEPVQAQQRLLAAERERDNIMAAIKMGIFTASTKGALEAAESSIATARAELEGLRRFEPAQMLPRAREIWRGMVERLGEIEEIAPAREAIKDLLGDQIRLVPEAGGLVAEIAGGIGALSQIKVVAGARYPVNLTRIVRIPLTTGLRAL